MSIDQQPARVEPATPAGHAPAPSTDPRGIQCLSCGEWFKVTSAGYCASCIRSYKVLDAPRPIEPAIPADEREVLNIDSSVRPFVRDYEFSPDEGSYTPTEDEQALIEDAIHGFISEYWFAVNRPTASSTDAPARVGEGEREATLEAALRWIRDHANKLRGGTDDWFELVEIATVADNALNRTTPTNTTRAESEGDTVAFVQEWMMSGDHEPDQWHRDFAAAIDARQPSANALAEAFCATPLPASVCADGCATMPDYPHPRSGTNLLTVAEAEQMMRQVLATAIRRETGEGEA